MNFSSATVEPFMGHWLTVLGILLILCGLYFGIRAVRSNVNKRKLKNIQLHKDSEQLWRQVNDQLFSPGKLISLSIGALCIVSGIVVVMGLSDNVTDEDRILLLNEQC